MTRVEHLWPSSVERGVALNNRVILFIIQIFKKIYIFIMSKHVFFLPRKIENGFYIFVTIKS